MESDLKIRKVTQDVLKFLCFKHQIILEEPAPELQFIQEITPQLMNNFCNAICIQSFLNDLVWSGFFEIHFKRMTFSPELFTKYVSFACYTFLDGVTEEYTMFFDTLSLVTYFCLRCWEKGSKQFLNACVDFFCAFYEKELRSKFESQGGFENFNEYLEEQINERDLPRLINANIRSFEQFHQREDIALQRRSFMLYNRAMEQFSQTKVETDEKVIGFAKSAAGKIGDLCQKTFEEILADFAKTESQVEEMFQQTVEEASGELQNISSRKVKEETLKRTGETRFEIKELLKQMATSHNWDTRNSKVPIEASSHLSPKFERLRKLLADISKDYSRLYELIQSLCEEPGVQFPLPMEAETKV